MKVANDSYIASLASEYKDVDGDYDWSTYINVKLHKEVFEAVREKVLKDYDGLDIAKLESLVVYVDVSSNTTEGNIQLFMNEDAYEPFAEIELIAHVQFSIA